MTTDDHDPKVLTSRTYLWMGFAAGTIGAFGLSVLPDWARMPWAILVGLATPMIGVIHVKRGGVIK